MDHPPASHHHSSFRPSRLNTSPAATPGNLTWAPHPTVDDENLARAIEESMNEAKAAQEARKSNRLSLPCPPVIDQATELVLSLNNAFNTLDEAEGDTAIYFGAPPQESWQNKRDYGYIQPHFDRVHVFSSKTLRLMGDTSRFTDKDLLGPVKSARAERMLRKTHPGVLEMAERKHGVTKFDYYIDLRPPQDGDEALILTTELSCTRGVLTWHFAKEKYDLPALRVLGQDEFEALDPIQAVGQQTNQPRLPSDKKASCDQTSLPAEEQSSGSTLPAPPTLPPPTIAPEYSLLRHYSGLERLLHAIQGNDPKLDSAPKMWTFFALANYFRCAAHERISRWITAWLYTSSNTYFIQNNPEVVYRIAINIKSPELVKDSFSILVGERALIEVYSVIKPGILTPLRENVHGRKLELLDDDERNRIDHAASSFVKRINEFVSTTFQDLDFFSRSTAYKMLDNIEDATPEEIDLLRKTKDNVKEYVRSRIYYVLCQGQSAPVELEQNLNSTHFFRSSTGQSFGDIYMCLNQPMRLFTKTFWLALHRTQFETGLSNISNEGTVGFHHDTRYTEGLKDLYKDAPINGITRISRYVFDDEISAVNLMLQNKQERIYNSKLHMSPDPATLPLGALHIASPATSQKPWWMPELEPRSPKRRKTNEFNNEPSDYNNNFRDGITTGFQQHDTSPFSTKPFWRGNDEFLPKMTHSPTPTTPGGNQPALAFRPKPMETSTNYPFSGFLEKPATGTQQGSRSVSNEFGFDIDAVSPMTTIAAPENNEGNLIYPINPQVLLYEIGDAISNVCSKILYPPHLFKHNDLLPTDLHDTLMCLDENEFRYLPLWVPDGNDDGTGGVFDEAPVPNIDPTTVGIESFGPGRIRHPHYQAYSEMDGEDITSSQAMSTIGRASKLATDGTQTVQSLASAPSTVRGDGDEDTDTIIVEMDGSRNDDAQSVVHVGEEASTSSRHGKNGDDEHGFEFEDDDDQDTINGDNSHQVEENVKAYLASVNDRPVFTAAHEKNNTGKDLDRTPNEKQGENKDRNTEGKDKGKGKAQNYPHDASTSPFDDYTDYSKYNSEDWIDPSQGFESYGSTLAFVPGSRPGSASHSLRPILRSNCGPDNGDEDRRGHKVTAKDEFDDDDEYDFI